MVAMADRIYIKSLEIAIGLLLAEMIVVGFSAVVARFFLSGYVSLYWAEEVIRYSFIWSVFLVSPLVIRRGANLELDLFLQWLSSRGRRAVALFNSLAILVFLGVLIGEGIRMVQVNVEQLSSALEISMAWIYLAVPTGGCLMFGEYLAILVRALRSTPEKAPEGRPAAVQ